VAALHILTQCLRKKRRAIFSPSSRLPQSDWLLTARPRLGFVTSNNWLFYATGGLAVTRLHTDITFDDNNPNVFAEEFGKIDTTKVGYAVGGGIEAPLTTSAIIFFELQTPNWGLTEAS
jgi:opacity protein-like surface antigen